MSTDTGRVTQVFVWKQGEAPDLPLAGRLLREVNPAAYRVVFGVPEALHLFSAGADWPANPWSLAVRDLQGIPEPAGGSWIDRQRYELAGWVGVDNNTGERVFVVTAHRRAAASAVEAATAEEAPAAAGQSLRADTPPEAEGSGPVGDALAGKEAEPPGHVAAQAEPAGPPEQPPVAEHAQAPTPDAARAPNAPRYPSSPIEWPPSTEGTAGEGWLSAPYLTAPLSTHPLAPSVAPEAVTGPLLDALRTTLLDGFAPYYAGFRQRLLAGLIDLAFMALFALFALLLIALTGSGGGASEQGGIFWWLVAAFLATFIAYHTIQLALWGQTLGKNLVGVRVVNARGRKPEVGRTLLRTVGYLFSLGAGGFGFAMIALDPRRQALHDKLAETFVIPEALSRPAPAGLPGYPGYGESSGAGTDATLGLARAMALASLGSVPEALEGRISPEPADDDGVLPIAESLEEGPPQPALEHEIPPVPVMAGAERDGQRARGLFRSGLAEMESGVEDSHYGFRVNEQAARRAAEHFGAALEVVPSSVLYRYLYAVALRYSAGFDEALPEFRRVLEIDPGHFEARQQVAYRSYWHDAFVYPGWPTEPRTHLGAPVPEPIARLLPTGEAAATRLVLLREGTNKMASLLCRAPRRLWKTDPASSSQAGLSFVLSRTQFGPLLALYLVLGSRGGEPFIGEAFLNPQEGLAETGDACLLGQHLLEQLTRQSGMYLILADEENRLLLSRRMGFDTSTQVSAVRLLYEVQSLPPQVMDTARLQQAAAWHMQHYPLEQVPAQALPLL